MRGLATVGLPVGVGGEADGGVEGESRTHPRETGGIGGQKALHALQQVHHAEAGDTEDEQRRGVSRPGHFIVLGDAGKPVQPALERSPEPGEPVAARRT